MRREIGFLTSVGSPRPAWPAALTLSRLLSLLPPLWPVLLTAVSVYLWALSAGPHTCWLLNESLPLSASVSVPISVSLSLTS